MSNIDHNYSYPGTFKCKPSRPCTMKNDGAYADLRKVRNTFESAIEFHFARVIAEEQPSSTAFPSHPPPNQPALGPG